MKSEFRIRFWLAWVLLLICGCTPRDYEDITSSVAAIDLIKREYILDVPLIAYGVDLFNEDSDNEVDFYYLMLPPGMGGPEILERHKIPEGTVVRIEGVLKCTNCYFSDRIEVLVSFPNIRFPNKEVRLKRLANFNHRTNKVELDPRLIPHP